MIGKLTKILVRGRITQLENEIGQAQKRYNSDIGSAEIWNKILTNLKKELYELKKEQE